MTRTTQPDEAPKFVVRRRNAENDLIEPRVLNRSFHGHLYGGWSGHVRFEDIGSWIDNPRTEYLKISFLRDSGILPTSEQMCLMMVEDDAPETGMGIKELAHSIAENGLRQALILTQDGRLLDGNRRYAALWWLRQMDADIPDDAKLVPVWVLDAEPHDDAEFYITTDLNFVGDYKKEWGQYVRARVLYHEWDKGKKNGGYSVPMLAQRYGWSQSRVRSYVNTAALIEEFLDQHEEAPEALEQAFEHFVWFEQLRRSNGKKLDGDYEFKAAIFDWILPREGEEGRFSQMKDFARLTEIREKPEAWEALENKTGPGALREAIYIVDGDKVPRGKDPKAKVERVVKDLTDLQSKGDLDKLDTKTLDAFHEVATQVPGAPPDAEARIYKMVDWLDQLSVGDMRSLSVDALETLRSVLDTVIKMAENARAEDATPPVTAAGVS